MRTIIFTALFALISATAPTSADARDGCSMSGKPYTVTGGTLVGKVDGLVKGARAYAMPGGKLCVGGLTYKRSEVRARFDSKATSTSCEAQLAGQSNTSSGSNLGIGC